jgi:hypothetical protein
MAVNQFRSAIDSSKTTRRSSTSRSKYTNCGSLVDEGAMHGIILEDLEDFRIRIKSFDANSLSLLGLALGAWRLALGASGGTASSYLNHSLIVTS